MTDAELRKIRDNERSLRNKRRLRLTGRYLHPEVVNRRKQAGGRRTAELLRIGVYSLPLVGNPHV
jgi:hypothetical protein